MPGVGPFAGSMTERAVNCLKLVIVGGNRTVKVRAIIPRHVHAEPIERHITKRASQRTVYRSFEVVHKALGVALGGYDFGGAKIEREGHARAAGL